MYHLTSDQYDALFLAVANLVSAIHEGREYATYTTHLSACIATLTGQYPEQDLVEMAKASSTKQEDIENMIRHLIGDFTYPSEYWTSNSISMDEVDALGGI